MKKAGWLGILCVCIASANAAIVWTRLIDTNYLFNTWYDYLGGTSGKITFVNTSVGNVKTLYTYGDVYTLTVEGTLTFESNLARDYSAGGIAKGFFEGGSTITLKGGLKQGTTFVYGGTGSAAKTILQAVMNPVYEDPQNPTLLRWALEESDTEVGRFDRVLFFTLVSGSEGLASGITLPNGDILKMADPKIDFSLKTQTAVNNFVSVDLNSGPLASVVKFVAPIPEPMTLLIFSAGGLALMLTKNNKK